MNISLSLNDIYAILATLSKHNNRNSLKFPKIPKEFKVSQEVMDMVVGKLPDDFDYDREVDKMYMERAR